MHEEEIFSLLESWGGGGGGRSETCSFPPIILYV